MDTERDSRRELSMVAGTTRSSGAASAAVDVVGLVRLRRRTWPLLPSPLCALRENRRFRFEPPAPPTCSSEIIESCTARPTWVAADHQPTDPDRPTAQPAVQLQLSVSDFR